MGRECNSIFRENLGLERLPFELAQSVDEIERTEIESPCSPAFQHFHARLRRRKPYQRYPIKIIVNENEEKNEILSRTVTPWRLLRIVVYWALVAVILDRVMGASATASLRSSNFLDNRRSSYQKPNKNCKEFDVTSRAFIADLIFEGTARSRSPAHGHGSRYEVTFVMHNILKQRGDAVRLSRKSQIRLHFGERGRRRPRFEQCSVSKVKSTKLAKANVKTGGAYFIFAHQANPMNYTAMGEPIVNNWRNRKSIESVLSRKGRRPHVLGLQNVSTGVSSPLRLSCQVRGLPVPRITWFKDGTSLIPTSRTIITYHRKNSTLEIALARLEDAGRYTCKATSVTGATATVSAYVNISDHQPERTIRPGSDWPNRAEKCQVDNFCLNGGSCGFFSKLGEHWCIYLDVSDAGRGSPVPVASRRTFLEPIITLMHELEALNNWFPGNLEEDMMLPTLKRLYRRRIRGHPGLSESEYRALILSLKDNKKFRHIFGLRKESEKPIADETDE